MKTIIAGLIVLAASLANAQSGAPLKRMMFVEAFDSGQPNAVILKLWDPGPEVLCYVLMPENAARRQTTGGTVIYEGNTVGSISCVPRANPGSSTPALIGSRQNQR